MVLYIPTYVDPRKLAKKNFATVMVLCMYIPLQCTTYKISANKYIITVQHAWINEDWLVLKMARRKFRTHKPTTLLSRDNLKQRGVGRPKKEHWREKRRREDKEEQKKLKHHRALTEAITPDCAYDNSAEREPRGLMPSTGAKRNKNEEVSSIHTSTTSSTNDEWGGDGTDWGEDSSTDWGGDGTEETIERFVEHTTQTQPMSLGQRLELVNVAYKIVHQCTGMIGGNGHGAAMYGEMMKSSLQRVVEKLISETGLSSCSRFLDVGCGLAKPQLHIAQMAGVEFSCGIDLDELRIFLANLNLKRVMKEARTNQDINTNCLVIYGDVEGAHCFEPFTHIYSFDVA